MLTHCDHCHNWISQYSSKLREGIVIQGNEITLGFPKLLGFEKLEECNDITEI